MSILRSCDHRVHQDDVAWYLFETVERKLAPLAAEKQTITAQNIVDAVAPILKRFDAVAYVKYISYHQPTMDAKTLRKHLRRG